jgi:hypothetical protein
MIKNDAFDKLTSEIIAFAVGSHHGEFDIIDMTAKTALNIGLKRKNQRYAMKNQKEIIFLL